MELSNNGDVGAVVVLGRDGMQLIVVLKMLLVRRWWSRYL